MAEQDKQLRGCHDSGVKVLRRMSEYLDEGISRRDYTEHTHKYG
jgi:hypothetical protein